MNPITQPPTHYCVAILYQPGKNGPFPTMVAEWLNEVWYSSWCDDTLDDTDFTHWKEITP